MISSEQLEIELGSRHPGRLLLVADGHTGAYDRNRAAASALVDHAILLHDRAQHQIRDAFELYATFGDDELKDVETIANRIFPKIVDCTYPYIYLNEGKIQSANLKTTGNHNAYARVLDVRPYYSELAEPELMKNYLIEQITALLDRGYSVEVGQSLNPIPVLYAVERIKVRRQIQSPLGARLLKTLFPVPDVSEVEDGIVDGHDLLNPSHLVSPERYRHFSSFFWSKYFDEITLERFLASVPTLPGAVDPAWQDDRRTPNAPIDDMTYYRSTVDLTGASKLTGDAAKPVSKHYNSSSAASAPLSLYTALRTDYSLARLQHYTLTQPSDFQDHILLTNYNTYMRNFIELACANLLLLDRETKKVDGTPKLIVSKKNKTADGDEHIYTANRVIKMLGSTEAEDSLLMRLAPPADDSDDDDPNSALPPKHPAVYAMLNEIQANMGECQMQAIHFDPANDYARERYEDTETLTFFERLVNEGRMPALSLINIGVGPSNAKNMTDHLAVLRPLSWTMVGHCAGVRRRQELGHYVIADICIRDDGVMDRHLPPHIPAKASPLVTAALNQSVEALIEADESHESRTDALEAMKRGVAALKQKVRTGYVFTTGDRLWETWPEAEIHRAFHDGRTVAVDMETSTIVANGLRHRVHAGSILCISDKPLHGAIKMRFFADDFYKRQVKRHLRASINAVLFMCVDRRTSFLLKNSREMTPPTTPPFS